MGCCILTWTQFHIRDSADNEKISINRNRGGDDKNSSGMIDICFNSHPANWSMGKAKKETKRIIMG